MDWMRIIINSIMIRLPLMLMVLNAWIPYGLINDVFWKHRLHILRQMDVWWDGANHRNSRCGEKMSLSLSLSLIFYSRLFFFFSAKMSQGGYYASHLTSSTLNEFTFSTFWNGDSFLLSSFSHFCYPLQNHHEISHQTWQEDPLNRLS